MLPKFTVICMILTHSKEVKSVTAAFFFQAFHFFSIYLTKMTLL